MRERELLAEKIERLHTQSHGVKAMKDPVTSILLSWNQMRLGLGEHGLVDVYITGSGFRAF
jgi:hypothetical protein